MQNVMRCVKIVSFIAKMISETNSKVCSKCPLSAWVPKNRNYTLYNTLSVSNNDSALSSKALGKANITSVRDRKREKETTIYCTSVLTWVPFFLF